MAEIQRLNHRHEQIINWLISNPDKQLGECAREFGYTQAWLSQLIHSDMFEAEYKARCRGLGVAVIHTLSAKMTGVAAMALDRTAELLSNHSGSEKFVVETTKNILDRIGYAPAQRPEGAQKPQLHVHVNMQELAEARERAAIRLSEREGTRLESGLEPKVLPPASAPAEKKSMFGKFLEETGLMKSEAQDVPQVEVLRPTRTLPANEPISLDALLA